MIRLYYKIVFSKEFQIEILIVLTAASHKKCTMSLGLEIKNVDRKIKMC